MSSIGRKQSRWGSNWSKRSRKLSRRGSNRSIRGRTTTVGEDVLLDVTVVLARPVI